jgi:hypothetical protein
VREIGPRRSDGHVGQLGEMERSRLDVQGIARPTGSNWMRTVGLALGAASCLASVLCGWQAVVSLALRLSPFAWKRHGCSRTGLSRGPCCSESRDLQRRLSACDASDNGGSTYCAVRRTCFSWPKGRAWCNRSTPRPSYWAHWLPGARHDNECRSTATGG